MALFKKGSIAAASGSIDNHLGENTSLQGTIKSDGNIRIDGIVQGNVETSGNVIIGPQAKVLADISANMVQVWGAVRGNIVAQGRLEILPSGRVWGDVQVLSMLIDEGGLYRGQCIMGGEAIEPLTLPEPPQPDSADESVRDEPEADASDEAVDAAAKVPDEDDEPDA